MVGLLSLFLFLLPSSGHLLELETDGPLSLYNLKAEVARDGSILIATPKAIYHWDQYGKLVQRLEVASLRDSSEPIFIATFAYDAKDGVYWIVDGKSRYSFFLDRQGRYLGKAAAFYKGEKDPVFIRDLISVGSRVFAMDGLIFSSAWGQSEKGLFQQVAWGRGPKGPWINLVGQSFGSATDIQREYAYDFKRHWIVQDGFSKDFFVVNQLSTSVQVFTARDEDIDHGLSDSGRTIPLIMPGWVETPSRQNGKTRPHPGEYYQMSQVRGFCAVGNDLLVVWSIPDHKDPESNEIGLQRFDRRGLLRGNPMRTSGVFLGVFESCAFILEVPENPGKKPRYQIKVLDL